jgi:simple sugar transport system ATP-binding protein
MFKHTITKDHTMSVAQSPPARLQMRGITKRFPGVVANDKIDLDVKAGEIHALLGENGAGKTTLMNVLFGLARPDEGEILIDGNPVRIADPADAIARGIGMVHQHFMLIPVLSVAENILLGAETMANPIFLDRNEARRRIIELGKRFGFEIDPDARVETLSVGWQQRVEILKALYRQARILVLDEPTAVLTPQETVEVFAVFRRLAAEGHSLIFISHKLYEVLEIADRITVIRRGQVVGSRLPSETNEDDLAALMVGRQVKLAVERGTSHPAEPVLTVENLRDRSDRGQEVVRGVSFNVRAGEILGIAGVAGNGQDELVEAITGLRRSTGGTVHLTGQNITGWTVRQRREHGLGYVPGDRQKYGLILGFPISDNLILTQYYSRPFARGIQREDPAIEGWAKEKIKEFDIRTPSWSVPAGTLSGGNQQKVIVAREFSRDLRLMVLDQPTRGLDVGSIEFIHKQAIPGLTPVLASRLVDWMRSSA